MRKTLLVLLATLGLLIGGTPAGATNGMATDPYEGLHFDFAWVQWSNTSSTVYFDVRSHVPFDGGDFKALVFLLDLGNADGAAACVTVTPGTLSEIEAMMEVGSCTASGVPLQVTRQDSGHLRIAIPIALLRAEGLGSRTSYRFNALSVDSADRMDTIPQGAVFMLTHDLAPEYRGCGPLGALDAELWPLAPWLADALCNIGR